MRIIIASTVMLIFTLLSCGSAKRHAAIESIDSVKPVDQVLFDAIRAKDSLLFQIGFNQIDTLQVANLVSDDFEFYHDEHGVTDSKSAFVNNINSIRELPFKTWRILVPGSMEIYPLYKDNSSVLYGAIQHGIHDFYQQNTGEDARKTNTARFTHLWILEDDVWTLKRVLSYDHQVPIE